MVIGPFSQAKMGWVRWFTSPMDTQAANRHLEMGRRPISESREKSWVSTGLDWTTQAIGQQHTFRFSHFLEIKHYI